LTDMTDQDGAASREPAVDVVDRGDGLPARVAEVETRPLEDRAEAFAALHDELRTRLEDGGGAGGVARA
jgi:hypothetical protein